MKLYYCFEHSVQYDGVDTLMCPRCEDDICKQHDPLWHYGEENDSSKHDTSHSANS